MLKEPLAVEQPTAEPNPLRFTAGDYCRMGETGVFTPQQRVEPIEGEIVEIPPIGVSRADWVDNLNMLFTRAVPNDVKVWAQNRVGLSTMCVERARLLPASQD